MKTDTTTVTLSGLLQVMGETETSKVCLYLADRPDGPVITDVATAASAYGDDPVTACWPAGTIQGRSDTNTYVIDTHRHQKRHGYLRNPNPIPVGIPCWRLRDEGYAVPADSDMPVLCVIEGISYPAKGRRDTNVTIRFQDGTTTIVPSDRLFSTVESAFAAMNQKEDAR